MEKNVWLWIGNERWNNICYKENIAGKPNGKLIGQNFFFCENTICIKCSQTEWRLKLWTTFEKKDYANDYDKTSEWVNTMKKKKMDMIIPINL